ncbi:hypothetical protein EMCRGX_G030556 [Ephydatia muelleri]|eukprot:Em0010g814a
MAFVWRSIRNAGGVKSAFRTLLKLGDIRVGTLVGTDSFGNKYYENNDYFFGRNRWVSYASKDDNASDIPPEWHRWMHYIGDHTPIQQPLESRKFQKPHEPNPTGTTKEYVPYSTTRPKIESWEPPKVTN